MAETLSIGSECQAVGVAWTKALRSGCLDLIITSPCSLMPSSLAHSPSPMPGPALTAMTDRWAAGISLANGRHCLDQHGS